MKTYKPSRQIFYTTFLALATLASVSLFWKNPAAAALLAALAGVLMLAARKSQKDILLYLVVGVLGASMEAVAIYFGTWAYSAPDVYGIPFWLPLAWGNAGIFVKRIAEEIDILYGR